MLEFLERFQEAEEAYSSGIRIQRHLSIRFPRARQVYVTSLAHAYTQLSSLLTSLARLEDRDTLLREALDIVSRCTSDNPDLATAHIACGIVLAELEQFDGAVAEYSKGIQLAPQDFYVCEWYAGRAHVYAVLDRPDLQLWDLSLAVETRPLLAEPYARRGMFYVSKNDWEGARSDFARAVELGPSIWTYWYHLGMADAMLGRWENAADHYARAIELHSQFPWNSNETPTAEDVSNAIGIAQYRIGRWQAAIELLSKSDESRDGSLRSVKYFFLAMSHWKMGHTVEAHRYFEQAEQWMQENASNDEELMRFREEAATVLKVAEHQTSEDAASVMSSSINSD